MKHTRNGLPVTLSTRKEGGLPVLSEELEAGGRNRCQKGSMIMVDAGRCTTWKLASKSAIRPQYRAASTQGWDSTLLNESLVCGAFLLETFTSI